MLSEKVQASRNLNEQSIQVLQDLLKNYEKDFKSKNAISRMLLVSRLTDNSGETGGVKQMVGAMACLKLLTWDGEIPDEHYMEGVLE